MFTAKFIKNIVFDGRKLRAIGRCGNITKVFGQQGDLDGSCTIYSLMMMLIFHRLLDWEDLIDSKRAKENDFVDSIQCEFLYGLNGLCLGGHVMDEVSDDLNQFFGKKISEVFTTVPEKYNYVSRKELHQKIKAQLDARMPVMLGFWGETGRGHCVVAIGYKREGHLLHLFCLDPGRPLSVMQVWNNVIDLDYLSCSDDAISDINHYGEEKVCVAKILIIHDNPPKLDCPF